MAPSRFITDAEIRRLKKAADHGFTSQPRRGRCLACGGDWMECPHSRVEIDQALEDAHAAKRMARFMGGSR